jgi:hypothetical protein
LFSLQGCLPGFTLGLSLILVSLQDCIPVSGLISLPHCFSSGFLSASFLQKKRHHQVPGL